MVFVSKKEKQKKKKKAFRQSKSIEKGNQEKSLKVLQFSLLALVSFPVMVLYLFLKFIYINSILLCIARDV